MRALRLEEFTGAVGETWEVDAGGTRLPFRLDVAQPLPSSLREDGSFRLEWVGPGAPLLPQAIYAFSRGDEAVEMFIVPVAREGEGCRYEAIFN